MPPLADIFPDASPVHGYLLLAGFLVAIYANAAKMPRLLIAAILFVMLTTLLIIIAASGAPKVPDELINSE